MLSPTSCYHRHNFSRAPRSTLSNGMPLSGHHDMLFTTGEPIGQGWRNVLRIEASLIAKAQNSINAIVTSHDNEPLA